MVNLSGDGATLNVGLGLDGVAGDAETANMMIQSGATVNIDALNGTQGAYLEIGLNETGNGILTIDGAGSRLDINSDVLDANEGSVYSGIVNVGRRGDGKLYVQNGGVLSVNANDDRGGSFDLGFAETGVGFVSVDTGGSILVSATASTPPFIGTIDIGREGRGTLEIKGGGVVTNAAADGASSVGREAGSQGLLTIDGAGSQFNAGSTLVIGSDFDFNTRSALANDGGTGTAVLTNGGSISAGDATVGSNGLLGGQGTITGNLALVGGRLGLDGTVGGASSRDSISITGDLTADALSTIQFDVDGFGAGEFDAVFVTGTTTLDKDALVLDLNAANAAAGSTATLISAGNLVTTGDTLQEVLDKQFGGTPVEAVSTLNGFTQGILLGDTGPDLVLVALNSNRVNDTATVDFGAAQPQGVQLATVNGFGVGIGGGYDNFNVYGVTAALGTVGSDTITMSTTSDLLIDGRDGDNTLSSGQGDDSVLSGIGSDFIATGFGDDLISAGAGTDTIIAGVGNDLVRSGLGADVVTFGDGTAGLSFGQDQLWGTVDELNGDTVTDFQSNDSIGVLDASGNVVAATLNVGGGEIQIDVGSNGVIDAVIAVSNTLFGVGTSLAGTNPFSGVPNIQSPPNPATASSPQTGTDGSDELTETTIDETFFALDGNDTVRAGGGNDLVFGGDGTDTLFGAAGNDTLHGGAGADTMDGGPGDDRFFVDDPDDVVIELADGGIDNLTTSIDVTLPDHVERGSTTGTGDIRITGNALDNFIVGNAGHNKLSGAGGRDRLIAYAGNDTLEGGADNDILEGGLGENVYVFGAGSGDDEIRDWQSGLDQLDFGPLGLRFVDLAILSSANEALITFEDGLGGEASVRLEGIDAETLTTAIMADPAGPGAPGGIELITGDTGSEVLIGTGADEDLVGLAGDDMLFGQGGNDTMAGGFGNDRYFLDDAGDIAIEQANQGIDQIDTAFDLVLPDHIERAAVRGGVSAGGAVDITGNDLNNFIVGSDQENVLIGGGGRDRLIAFGGDDTLEGGADNDVLEGGLGADLFIFDVDGGIDLISDFEVGIDLIDVTALGIAFADMRIVDGTVGALVYFDLTPGSVDLVTLQGVAAEDVRLTSFVGAPNLPIVGTDGNDVLRGTVEDDELQGLGGNDQVDGLGGADVMIGGPGDDRYFIDNLGDTVIELPGEGTDVVTVSVSFTLPDHVENAGTRTQAAVDITGNALGNLINGNAAANTLSGLDGDDNLLGFEGTDVIIGGLGADLLRGGTDADVFVFAPGDGQGAGDQILDFELGVDTIDLSATGLAFTDLTIADVGTNATVTYGTDVVTVFGTSAAQLTEDQFDFTP
ncbi:MAG: hypothetical protein AAF293_02515 [Pseudomonadota bacterium]